MEKAPSWWEHERISMWQYLYLSPALGYDPRRGQKVIARGDDV
jgi:hypothetical protein